MSPDEDFWGDLLGHLREGRLIPIVGPGLITVEDGGRSLTLSRLIAERLADRYNVSVEWNDRSMLDDAVRSVLAHIGRDKLDRLYRVINDLLSDLSPAPSDALTQLGSITDLRLFISTTFDSSLARAIDAARYEGKPVTQQLWFAPNQSTEAQQANAAAPKNEAVVFKLFGEASSVPQYAIHEEDTLEWLHALLSESARLPEWLQHQLKERPLLLLGCHMPDWVGRFMIRMASAGRLSQSSKQFFIVGSSAARNSELMAFFKTYCSATAIQVAEQDPSEFAIELASRWRKRQGGARIEASPTLPRSVPSGGIFISYVREDIEAARHLASAISAIGGEIWLDERRLQPGDQWESEILGNIRRGVRLFLPLISQHTEAREEGYVFKEWREAVERSKGIPGRRFIVPIVIDSAFSGDANSYQKVPEEFRDFHFGQAPNGQPTPALLKTMAEEIRAMRRMEVA